VVRLKGGDPFLFGRGAEEALALRAAGLPFEIVPGVSSPLGATAYAGIPLTHRELASSVTMVTAVKQDGEGFDWSELACVKGTLCVFMGARHLEAISLALVSEGGRAPDTPAAVIEWISYPRQRSVAGRLDAIASLAAEAGLGTPSLLVVGDVVRLRESLGWFEAQPLFGKRVLVTRPAHQIAPTAALLRRRGAEPVPFPTIALQPADPAPVAEAVAQLDDYDLVAFTSRNGVDYFWEAIEAAGRDARAFGRCRLAAIGPATAEGLTAHGLRADLVAETFVAEHLASAVLAALPPGARVLLPRAEVAREVLPEMLRDAGMTVDVVPVYQTVTAEPTTSLRELVADIDVITLTSSSTVDKLVELVGDGAAEALAGIVLASIGPITTRTAERHGLTVAVTATVSTGPGLIEALEAHYRKSGGFSAA
ncbi:MAG: uroporphyrinogen-III synthase, partial [Myxococcales bacterium]|nr:uroporphyrinogen-III synthase [Myxococcales bacterium]